MSIVFSLILCVSGSITMICWTIMTVSIMIDHFKNRKKLVNVGRATGGMTVRVGLRKCYHENFRN